MKRHISAALFCAGAAISACSILDTNAVKVIATDDIPTARIKFHNFSPSSVGVNFFANNVKVSAIGSTACQPPATAADTILCNTVGKESATGVVYGGLASGGLYTGVAPAAYTLTAKMAAKDTVVASVSQTIAAGKYYSFFMSGIYNTTTKTAAAFIVDDPIPAGAIDFSKAYVRLVNAVSDGTGPLTLYATSTATGAAAVAQGTAVTYQTAGTYVLIDEGVYSLGVRYTGAGTDLISLTGTNVQTLVGGRLYTVTARGSTATASTLGLSFLQNNR